MADVRSCVVILQKLDAVVPTTTAKLPTFTVAPEDERLLHVGALYASAGKPERQTSMS
jgi:hypothetical protein